MKINRNSPEDKVKDFMKWMKELYTKTKYEVGPQKLHGVMNILVIVTIILVISNVILPMQYTCICRDGPEEIGLVSLLKYVIKPDKTDLSWEIAL